MKTLTSRERGQHIEDLACQYLQQQGLKKVTRNYSSRSGEIDLIMLDGKSLIFVEVRFRKTTTHGSAVESVTRNKQQRIIQTAMLYLQKHPHKGPCRFDVVGVTMNGTKPQIEWVKDAFQC